MIIHLRQGFILACEFHANKFYQNTQHDDLIYAIALLLIGLRRIDKNFQLSHDVTPYYLWNLDGFHIALEKGLIAMGMLDFTEPYLVE